MAFQCQYDLEAHLGHIITFLHPRIFIYFYIISVVLLRQCDRKTDLMKIIATTKSLT